MGTKASRKVYSKEFKSSKRSRNYIYLDTTRLALSFVDT